MVPQESHIENVSLLKANCLMTVSFGVVAFCKNVIKYFGNHNEFFILFILHFKSLFQSPLVQAIFSRNTEEVTFLLNHNEDVSSPVILSHITVTLQSCCFLRAVILGQMLRCLLSMNGLAMHLCCRHRDMAFLHCQHSFSLVVNSDLWMFLINARLPSNFFWTVSYET